MIPDFMRKQSESEITRKTYNKIAKAWSERNFKSKKIKREIGIFSSMVKDGGKVLDAGCGPGRHSAMLLANGYKVTGIDFSRSMINEARKRVPEGNFMLMDMTRLKFPKNSFDGIWCFAALLHVEKGKAARVLEGFRKVIKPGGILGLSVKEGSGQGMEHNESGLHIDDRRFFAFYTEKELVDLVKKAGFEAAKVRHKRLTNNWIIVFARNAK